MNFAPRPHGHSQSIEPAILLRRPNINHLATVVSFVPKPERVGCFHEEGQPMSLLQIIRIQNGLAWWGNRLRDRWPGAWRLFFSAATWEQCLNSGVSASLQSANSTSSLLRTPQVHTGNANRCRYYKKIRVHSGLGNRFRSERKAFPLG